MSRPTKSVRTPGGTVEVELGDDVEEVIELQSIQTLSGRVRFTGGVVTDGDGAATDDGTDSPTGSTPNRTRKVGIQALSSQSFCSRVLDSDMERAQRQATAVAPQRRSVFARWFFSLRTVSAALMLLAVVLTAGIVWGVFYKNSIDATEILAIKYRTGVLENMRISLDLYDTRVYTHLQTCAGHLEDRDVTMDGLFRVMKKTADDLFPLNVSFVSLEIRPGMEFGKLEPAYWMWARLPGHAEDSFIKLDPSTAATQSFSHLDVFDVLPDVPYPDNLVGPTRSMNGSMQGRQKPLSLTEPYRDVYKIMYEEDGFECSVEPGWLFQTVNAISVPLIHKGRVYGFLRAEYQIVQMMRILSGLAKRAKLNGMVMMISRDGVMIGSSSSSTYDETALLCDDTATANLMLYQDVSDELTRALGEAVVTTALNPEDFLTSVCDMSVDISSDIVLSEHFSKGLMVVIVKKEEAYGPILLSVSSDLAQLRSLNFNTKSDPSRRSRIDELRTLQVAFLSMKQGLEAFTLYMPRAVVEQTLTRERPPGLGMVPANCSIFFSDVVNFTAITEELEPDVLVRLIGEYLEDMSTLIVENHGTIDKFVGDAIVAFWNAPQPVERPVKGSVEAAVLNQMRLAQLRLRWSALGLPALECRIGINCGRVLVGNYGCNTRMDFTVIGDNVNLASRLEGLNKMYGTTIMVSDAVVKSEDVARVFVLRMLGRVAVKGRVHSTEVYEVLGYDADVPDERRGIATQYETGLSCFFGREFSRARNLFAENAEADPPSQHMLELCEELLRNPPGPDWDGVERLDRK